MAEWPTVGSATVSWRVASVYSDGVDVDLVPDIIPEENTLVTLKPSIKDFIAYGFGENAVTLRPQAVTGIIDADGYLMKPSIADELIAGTNPVIIMATNDPNASITGWWWTAYVEIRGRKYTVDFAANVGETVNISDFIKAPPSKVLKPWIEQIPDLLNIVAEVGTVKDTLVEILEIKNDVTLSASAANQSKIAAANSAAQALTSKNAAAQSVTDAQNLVANVQESVNTAGNHANSALASRNAAATSASEALTSRNQAETFTSNASNAAAEAAVSLSGAATSASHALESKNQASQSAINAATSAIEANTSATQANQAKEVAVQSASNAEASKNQAASTLANVIPKDLVTSKGDLLVGGGAASLLRFGSGTNGQFLVSDNSSVSGLKWDGPNELKGFGSPVGALQAPINTIYRDLENTHGALYWLKLNNTINGWSVIYGDTGWRNISNMVNNELVVTSCSLFIKRLNNLIHFSANSFTIDNNNTLGANLIRIPPGFRSGIYLWRETNPGYTSSKVYLVAGSVQYIAFATPPKGDNRFTAYWHAHDQEPWPTILP